MMLRRSVTCMVMLIVLLVISVSQVRSRTGTSSFQDSGRLERAEPPAPAVASAKGVPAEICMQILTRAIQSLRSTCNDLSRNSACYGNTQVKVEPNGGAALKFDTVGDRAPIRNVRTLITLPLDVDAGTWGLSLLKLQANLPDTLPGQNVTFLVFGDTSIENVSGDMQSFYFTSGLGSLTCKEAPRDGIVVRSPQHTEITFTANGVTITIASTIVLRAERNKSMSIELVEGHARVSTRAGSQTLKPGQITSVTLGGANGLLATDAPAAPTAGVIDATLGPIFVSTGQMTDPDAAVKITIEGCISAVNGNTMIVNDYHINIDSNKTLKNAKVGDCVHIDGTLKTDASDKITLSVITAQPSAKINTSATGDKGERQSNGENKDKDKDKAKDKPDNIENGGKDKDKTKGQ